MKILWLTWKDKTHPQAGGAELVNEELAKRLVADGHQVNFIVGGYKGCDMYEQHPDGYTIVRLGSRWTVYWKSYRFYKKYMQNKMDLIIDEVNTVPFFAKYYVKECNILFVHQLCRQIWFYQLVFPLSLIGWLIEPIYLRILSDRKVITISKSTKKDLMRHGFKEVNIRIISEGLEVKPFKKLPPLSTKFKEPAILALGSVRPMKRTMHQLRAFEIAKQEIPDLRLIIAGNTEGRYGKKLANAIKASKYAKDIELSGWINAREKVDLLTRSQLIIQTAVKEGWGLTITEAAALGTPAAAYNVDGLRDSIQNKKTGLIAKQNNPQSLAEIIVKLLNNRKNYAAMRRAGWEWSKDINFDKCYRDFKKAIKK